MGGRTDGQTDRQADRKRDRIEAKQHSSCRNVAIKEFGHDLGVLWSRACGVLDCFTDLVYRYYKVSLVPSP